MDQRLASLAALLPEFEAPDFEFGQWFEMDRVTIAQPFDFSPPAERLLDACYKMGWIQVFDWRSWENDPEGQSLQTDPEALAQATPEQLSRLLTSLIREERFCDGILNAAFESGLLARILRRAAALAQTVPRDRDGV